MTTRGPESLLYSPHGGGQALWRTAEGWASVGRWCQGSGSLLASAGALRGMLGQGLTPDILSSAPQRPPEGFDTQGLAFRCF